MQPRQREAAEGTGFGKESFTSLLFPSPLYLAVSALNRDNLFWTREHLLDPKWPWAGYQILKGCFVPAKSFSEVSYTSISKNEV